MTLREVFRFGSDSYVAPRKRLALLLPVVPVDREHVFAKGTIFRDRADHDRPIHMAIDKPATDYSERVEAAGYLPPGEKLEHYRVTINAPFTIDKPGKQRRILTKRTNMPEPLMQLDFTLNDVGTFAEITHLCIDGQPVKLDEENVGKALSLASVCVDQVLSGSRLTFEDNYQRIYGKSKPQSLRCMMVNPGKRRPKHCTPRM